MSNLELKILSSRPETNRGNTSICYLCEGDLESYVKSIPKFYEEYDVQRGIISNVYLDRLSKTILEGKFIPPIVLIAEEANKINATELLISNYKILDGLQRTHRIKSIYNALNFFIEKSAQEDILSMSKQMLSINYKKNLKDIMTDVATLSTISSIVKTNNYSIQDLKKAYGNFTQWFEVWTNLDEMEQINKMLVLNAGHKPMDIKHQLELIFLNIIAKEDLKPFKRAKDINSSFFYKNKLEEELHLSHFISAILSFGEGKPITVDAKFVQVLQDDIDKKLENVKYYFEKNTLKAFVEFTKKLDVIFNNAYPGNDSNNNEGGLKWLGRETVLVGLFAAFGKFYHQSKNKNIQDCLNTIIYKIEKNINIFNINGFNQAKRTSIDVTKVNIGNIFKKTTYIAMSKFLLEDELSVDWNNLFTSDNKVNNDSE